MTPILTNDDGIDAPGLQALQQAVEQLSSEKLALETYFIVAPHEHLSGCSHQVTTHRPIRVQQRGDTAFAVEGSPADCARLGIRQLCPQATWVLSGINAGGNLGADIHISGTVAAVREAALLGLPAIAISHYRQGKRPIDWSLAARLTATVLADLLPRPLPTRSFWNVNLPHLEPGAADPDVVICPLSNEPLPTNYRREGDCFHYAGNYSQRDRAPGTDVDVCFSGRIAVSLLQL